MSSPPLCQDGRERSAAEETEKELSHARSVAQDPGIPGPLVVVSTQTLAHKYVWDTNLYKAQRRSETEKKSSGKETK